MAKRKGGWNGMELWLLGSFGSFSFMTFWAFFRGPSPVELGHYSL